MISWLRPLVAILLTTVATLLVAGLSAAASPILDWHSATLIDNADSYNPAVVVDASGVSTVVWDQLNGTRADVWGNRYVPGAGWGFPTLIEDDDAASAYEPHAAVDATGTVTAAWCMSDGEVWANQYFPASGWGTPTLVEANTTAGCSGPQVVVDPGGNATAVWYETRFIPTFVRDIWASRFVPGSGWEPALLIETNEGQAQEPQIDVSDSGEVTAVWLQLNVTLNKLDVWANRYVPGSGWGTAALIEMHDGNAGWPDIAVEANGNATAVWEQYNFTNASLFSNRYTVGSGWGLAAPIPMSNDSGGGTNAQVATDENGTAFATWKQWDGIVYSIWASRYTPGYGWGNASLLETDSGLAHDPALAVSAAGEATVAWGQDDGVRWNMWANRFVPNVGWGNATLLESGDGNVTWPSVAADTSGYVTVVWPQYDGTFYSLWANRFGPASNITVMSSPVGLEFAVNGTNYTVSTSFSCFKHVPIAALSPQEIEGVRYGLENWSDGGARMHFADCSADRTIIASFVPTDFQVQLITTPPGLTLMIDGIPSPGNASFWWSAGSTHTFSDPGGQTLGDMHFRLSNWSDSSDSNRTILIGAPLELVAYFAVSEYRVQVDSVPAGRSVQINGLSVPTPVVRWFQPGSLLDVGIVSPQLASPGIRYGYAQWDDGGSQNRSMPLMAPLSLTARFFAEFSVSITSSPMDFTLEIDGVPMRAPVENWWADGSSHALNQPASLQEVGQVRYVLSAWRDGSPTNRSFVVSGPQSIGAVFAPSEYFVRLTTNPVPLELEIDGATAMAPIEAWWAVGSIHWIGAVSPQAGGSERFTFSSWSDSLGTTHLAVADGPLALSALYDIQCAVTIDASPGVTALAVDGQFQAIPASLWWTNGSTHTVGLLPPSVSSPDTRFEWSKWSDGGNRSHSVIVGGPLSVRAEFVTMFLLVADSPFTIPACDVANCWYANGSMAAVSVQAFLSAGEGTRNAFAGWVGDVTDSHASATILMDGPKRLSASWKLQYELRVESAYGSTTGQGWYDAGSTAHLAVVWPNATSSGASFVFGGWRGGIESDALELDLTMDSPKSVTVNWVAAAGPSSSLPIEVAGASILTLIIAGLVSVTSSRAGFALDGFVTVPLFTRLKKIDVTSQYQRGRLIQFIDDNPGASYSEIRRRLQIANGGCAYHLRVLERSGEIRRVAHGTSVRFYPADYRVDPESLPPLSLVQRRILELLLARPESAAAELGKTLASEGHAISESTLLYHMKTLAREKSLITMRREAGRTKYSLTSEQAAYLRRRLGEEAAADTLLDRAMDSNHGNGEPHGAPQATEPKDEDQGGK